MEGLFLQVLNMSISASWLIVAVLIIRVLLKKAKTFCYILWFFVAVRLLCPIALESTLSLIPSEETFSEEFLYEEQPEINSGIEGIDNVVNPMISQQATGNNRVEQELEAPTVEETPNTDNSVSNQDSNKNNQNASTDNDVTAENTDSIDTMGANKETACGTTETGMYPMQSIIQVSSWAWGTGIIAMLVYTLISYIKLQNTVNVSVHLRDNLWICDGIQSPFILGLLNPRIYLPSHIEEEQIRYIVAHENEHLRYHDNWWKPLGFGILAIHWFNPLVWVAYICMCRDIELACDERVIRRMNNTEKKKYMESLLICSSPRHLISACPVAFGEIGIKERIKSVLNYKKPAGAIFGIGAVICVIVFLCFMTNPEDKKEEFPSMVWYEASMDVTHDGKPDLIQTVFYYKEEGTRLDDVDNYVKIKVYQGLDDNSYEEEPIYESREYGYAEDRKGTIGYTRKDGLYYLFTADIQDIDGMATYAYSAFYLKDGEAEIVDSDTIEFVSDESKRPNVEGNLPENVLPGFKEKLQPWLNEGVLLASYDVSHFVSREFNVSFAFEYFDALWNRNGDIMGEEDYVDDSFAENDWQGVIRDIWGTGECDIQWFETELASDFSEWFTEYNGEKIQRIEDCHNDCQGNCSVATCCDIIYFKPDAGDDLQTIVYQMIEAMILPRMEDSANRTYTITAYDIPEQEFLQISENMWLINYLNGYYAFEGIDVYTMEECYPKDGDLVHFQGTAKDSGWCYILIEKDGVYRLQRYKNMLLEKAERTEYDEGNAVWEGMNFHVWEERSWDEIVALYPNHPDVQKIEKDFNSEEADLSKWFDAYNGQQWQVIESTEQYEESHTVTGRKEIIYYRTNETDIQKVLHEMLTVMIDPLMEEAEGRYFTITKYELDEVQPLKQINENVWMLRIISGYYAYEGTDMGTMEEVMEYEEVKDGMIRFLAQGSDGVFQYLLIREGNVYRLQRAGDMGGYGID